MSKRVYIRALTAAVAVCSLQGTTLEQLSLTQMARQSTAIVRARVTGSANFVRGENAFTQYRLDVAGVWKSTGGSAPTEVAVPGGIAQGFRQVVSGAPSLRTGSEYVLFLWTSPRGLTQIVGLSQGLFVVERAEAGEDVVIRAAASERILNQAGEPVSDQQVRLKLAELKAQVEQALGGRK